MHSFGDLIDRCTAFTLAALNTASAHISKEFETSAATRLVKASQAVQLQRAIFAVGMFSIFEAHLQDALQCANGFRAANEILGKREPSLRERFINLQHAINVLKHGRGRSYNALVRKARSEPGALGFRIKLPEEPFFDEGDVSEVGTLIQVDDSFVRDCAQTIQSVSTALGKQRRELHL